MRIRTASITLAAAAVISFGISGPLLAETASESYHQAGESTESAGHSAGHAIKHAWEGTKTAVKDTDITAKVKMALHDDKVTKDKGIDVDTRDGVVTLSGTVPSEHTASQAEHLATNTTGVKSVQNDLKVRSSANDSD